MYIEAIQDSYVSPESGMISTPTIVGRFVIPEGTPAFTPVRVPFEQTAPLEAPLTSEWAWVAHNGAGMVAGDTDEVFPEYMLQQFAEAYTYLPNSDCDCAVWV